MQKRVRIGIGLFVGFIFLFTFTLSLRVHAQTADQEWSTPENLSQSGSATEPHSVTSSDGVVHIVWKDAFNGVTYVEGNGETLSEPAAADFPFGRQVFLLNGGTTRTNYTPLLKADLNNRIHALWVDSDSALFYSRVIAEDFGTYSSWTADQQLAEVALAYDLDIAVDDVLHLAYIRPISTEDFPSGVYYRNSVDGGTTWSAPVLLYQSPYFRSLSSQAARISLQATDEGQVIIAWDNRPEERVYFIRSTDSGTSWQESVEVDQRQSDDLDNAVGPSNISLVDDGSTLHLFWQAGHEAFLCAQYHQWSTNGGETWQPTRRILTDFDGCSQRNEFVVVPGGMVMVSAFEAGVYTQFWDGDHWSQIQRQGILSGFSNPSTYRQVDLGCRNYIVQNNQVYVLGCDTSDNNDIWKLSTSLANLTQSAAASNEVWTAEEMVALQPEGVRMNSPLLVGDPDGRLHAMWSQETNNNSTIYYMVSEGTGWSTPLDILASPGANSASENPKAVYHPEGQLMVVWDNGSEGEIYFSHVSTALADSAAEWFAPEQLPTLRSTAGSPDIAIGPDGRIYVVYALQLNEERGVYLVISEDDGVSWSNPILIFDAAGADWDAVDHPQIVLSGDGFIHVTWVQKTLPPNSTPIATYYSASTNGGETWSDAVELPFADVPPVWSELGVTGLQTIFRIWQEDVDNGSNYWSQISNDSGLNWQQPVRISERNNPLGIAALAVDGAGRPNLIQLAGFTGTAQADEGVSPGIQHWAWLDDGWSAPEGFDIQPGVLSGVEGVSAVIGSNGDLTILYSGLNLDVETGRLQPGYLSSSRSLSIAPPSELPEPATIEATTTITTGQTVTETVSPTPVPTIQPTPTVFFPQEPDSGGGFSIPGLGSLGMIGAVIPIGIVVLMIVLLSVRLVRRSQN